MSFGGSEKRAELLCYLEASWFTAPHKQLQARLETFFFPTRKTEWDRCRVLLHQWYSLQLCERWSSCSRGKATDFSTTLGMLLPQSTSLDLEVMKICSIALQRMSCRAIYNSQNNSVVTSSCSHKIVFPSASGDESAVVITRVRGRLEKMSVEVLWQWKIKLQSDFFMEHFFLSPGHQIDWLLKKEEKEWERKKRTWMIFLSVCQYLRAFGKVV